MFLKKSCYSSLFIGLILAVGFMACDHEEDEILEVHPLQVVEMEEQFDAEGNVYVKASFTTKQPDTVVAAGFIYTDAVENYIEPQPNVDHTLTLTTITPDESASPYTYSFEGLINPIRTSPKYYDSSWPVNVIAFIKSTSGKTYYSTTASLMGDKLKLVDLYPRKAPPGALVRGVINRQFSNNKIYPTTTGGIGAVSFDAHIIVGEHTIAIDSTENQNIFYFRMPEGLNSETAITLKVNQYEATYENKIKNTERSFVFLDLRRRDHIIGTLLFCSPGAIYLGGGEDPATSKLLTDFWRFDVTTKLWSRIADYPETGRVYGMTFTIGDNGYCGNPDILYKYNLQANQWSLVPKPTNDLQYNHTFTSAASMVYDGKAYFTSFQNKLVGGSYCNNFWRFDPITQTYTGLNDYPGATINARYSTDMDRGVELDGRLHFFRLLQHWSYSLTNLTWTQHADVNQAGDNIKVFRFHGKMYGIVTEIIPGGFSGYTGKLPVLYQYDSGVDKWIRDSDMPRIYEDFEINPEPTGFYILQVSDDEVYLCQSNSGSSEYSFYKIK